MTMVKTFFFIILYSSRFFSLPLKLFFHSFILFHRFNFRSLCCRWPLRKNEMVGGVWDGEKCPNFFFDQSFVTFFFINEIFFMEREMSINIFLNGELYYIFILF